MGAKLLIDIPVINWAYTLSLEEAKEYSIGTAAENSIKLPAGSASSRHATLTYKEGWRVLDCKSETGTLINGKPVEEKRLADRDILRMGKCEIVFQSPDQKAQQEEWGSTCKVVSGQQSALKQIAEQAAGGSIQLSDLEGSYIGRSHRASQAARGDHVKLTPLFAAQQPANPEISAAADLVWAAQKLGAIMPIVLSKPASRDETYTLMLQQLRIAIGADNGFVMIPNETNSRWIVRAWVGDSSGWTQYEKTHPLPVTVTNRAFQTSSIVSNALASANEDPINSSSMKALKVNGYIAVPLLEAQKRRGVLYFDTRNENSKFRSRDVKLLELAGACILEIEDQRK